VTGTKQRLNHTGRELVLHPQEQKESHTEAGRTMPDFQPPLRPSIEGVYALPKGEARQAAMRGYMEALEQYDDALVAWELATARNVALIFDHSDAVHAITRNIGGGWRTTSFSKIDHMPICHFGYSSRIAALREERGSRRIERIPFEVEPLKPAYIRDIQLI